MKSIQVFFEDEDFAQLDAKKGDRSWREFILEIAKIKVSK